MEKRREYIIINNSLLEVFVYQGRIRLYEHIIENEMYKDLDKWVNNANARLEVSNRLKMGHINHSKSELIKY